MPIRVMTQVFILLNSISIHTIHSHISIYQYQSIQILTTIKQAVPVIYNYTSLKSLSTINY